MDLVSEINVYIIMLAFFCWIYKVIHQFDDAIPSEARITPSKVQY